MNISAFVIWIAFLIFGVCTIFFIRKTYKKHMLLLTAIATLLISIILYRHFLLGNANFLYTVVDGFSQYLPTYMNYVRTIQAGQGLPWWTFSIGFGAVQSYDVLLYPLNLVPVLAGVCFGEQALLISFAWMQVVKMVLAAVFMFLFLKKIGFTPFVCCNIGLLYAFCGIIILRGHWVFLADECYIAVLILWCAECYFQDKKWYAIPPAIFLLGSCLGIFYLYLYAVLLIVYTTVRYFYAQKPAKHFFSFLLSCGGLYILGILLWGIVLIGFSWSLFTTARFSTTVSYTNNFGLFEHVDWSVLTSAIFSLFDPNVTGIFDNYTGALNYLERPLFYCGIACLFLIPQGIALGKKRTKKLIVFGICSAGLYMLFPIVVDIFNAFIRNEELGLRSYRISTLWIVIMMFVMGAYGLQCGIQNGRFHRTTLLATSLALIALFFYVCIEAPYDGITLNFSIIRWVILFFLVWLFILLWIKWPQKMAHIRTRSLALILCISLLELFHSANVTLTKSTQTATENYTQMQEDSLGYYSDVSLAVEYLKEYDNGLYRVSGIRPSAGVATYCAPLYFGVHDSSYYTDIDAGTYAFLAEVYPQSFLNGVGSKYSTGVGDNLMLSTLTGYKYIITQYDLRGELPYGYKLLKHIGNIAIYENTLDLSFGITFDSYVRRSIFEEYSDEEQKLILLHCAVLEDNVETNLTELTKSDLDKAISDQLEHPSDTYRLYRLFAKQRQEKLLEVNEWTENHINGTLSLAEDKLLVLSIPNADGWRVLIDGTPVDPQTVDIGFMGIYIEAGEHTVELEYCPKTLIPGVIVSLFALGIYVTLVILSRRKHVDIQKYDDSQSPIDKSPQKITQTYAQASETVIKESDTT